MAVEPAKGQRASLTIPVAATAAVTFLCFLLFESTKELLFSRLPASHAPSRWESHIYTIVFGTLVASLLAYFIGRRRSQLYQQLLETAEQNRETAERLAWSEERYRLLLESTGEGILGADMDGRCTFCNPAALRLLGYEGIAEILGKKVHALVHHTHADGTPFPVEECPGFKANRQGLAVHVCDDVYWKKDGTSLPVEYWSYPILHDGEPIGAVVAFLDITARRRDEEAVHRLAEIVESSQDAILSVSLDGNIQSWNEGAERVFGYSAEEAVGAPVGMLSALDEQDETRAIFEKIQARQKVDQYETSRIRKDGKRIEIALTASPMTDSGGRLTGVSAIIRDITEKRNLQGQLMQSQKMEAIGQVAGGVAHDFNNLLTVINGNAELLLDRISPYQPAYEHLGQIQKAAQQAASLTRQLLAFSRKQKLQARVLDLNEIVEAMGMMLPRVLRSDIEVSLKLGAALGSVRADQTQIEQVVLNLAVNARDAMPKGGELIIETAEIEFDEDYAHTHLGVQPGRYVMLAVTDSGMGMDAETQARIFEPFFTTKPTGQGTGLGLATVHGIVKQSQGWIWVYSEVGRGTTFKVYLPRIEESAAAARADASGKQRLRGTETILVAEDQDSIRALAVGLLQSLGYSVLQAKDGAEALEVAAEHRRKIHLLLTDVLMPKMNGRELVEKLTVVDPELRVLLMSAYPESQTFTQSSREVADGFIQKPFSLRDLATKVREILDAPSSVAA
jgi:PAS domain S-box-containing protein